MATDEIECVGGTTVCVMCICTRNYFSDFLVQIGTEEQCIYSSTTVVKIGASISCVAAHTILAKKKTPPFSVGWRGVVIMTAPSVCWLFACVEKDKKESSGGSLFHAD